MKIQSRPTSFLCFGALVASASTPLLVRGETAAASATDEEAAAPCASICAEGSTLSTPDAVVEYNWDPRVPTCAGLSCETSSCSLLEGKLPAYGGDATACERHQSGLQAAGCGCETSNSSSSYSSVGFRSVVVSVVATATAWMLAGAL
mmetsp:Transcript_7012/g.20360  ORF Transcript_7012/g.20360 Transcript_7012/m.20360 type:complete len:148 (-) Transcript_7012:1230-1673(-)